MSESDVRFKSAFSFGGPALFHPRARLFADHVELTGWRFRGRYCRTIPLGQILQVDVPTSDELLLWLSNGQTLRLRIDQAEAWKDRITGQQSRLNGRHRA